MDSMTEMFYDECSGILRDIRKGLQMGHEDGWDNQEAVQEIFRGVHTLKADSAMMLYEALAELSSVLESLLYCFRGEGKRVTDAERFERVINAYLEFFEQETDKLANGGIPNAPSVNWKQRLEILWLLLRRIWKRQKKRSTIRQFPNQEDRFSILPVPVMKKCLH